MLHHAHTVTHTTEYNALRRPRPLSLPLSPSHPSLPPYFVPVGEMIFVWFTGGKGIQMVWYSPMYYRFKHGGSKVGQRVIQKIQTMLGKT